MGEKLRNWVKNSKLVLSVVKIIVGIILGVSAAVPVFYNVAADLLDENESEDFIDVKYKIDCITFDINSEFSDDLRQFDLEYIMDRYALLREKYKTPALNLKMQNIERFYYKLINGG